MRIQLFDLGLVDFQTAWFLQKTTFQQVKTQNLPSAFILCQHYPVITLGRKAKRENILADEKKLQELNIKTFEIERGGDVTYHGPGQLCVYPIINLAHFKKDINWYLRKLEAIGQLVLAEFDIKTQIKPGLTGIWVNNKKIASIGIAIRNWITFHGLSLNIDRDKKMNFSLIRPCGQDIIMTTMEDLKKEEVDIKRVKEVLVKNIKIYFGGQYETSNFT